MTAENINTISLRDTHLSQDTNSSRRKQTDRVRKSLKPYKVSSSPFLCCIKSALRVLSVKSITTSVLYFPYVTKIQTCSRRQPSHVTGVNWLDKTWIETKFLKNWENKTLVSTTVTQQNSRSKHPLNTNSSLVRLCNIFSLFAIIAPAVHTGHWARSRRSLGPSRPQS